MKEGLRVDAFVNKWIKVAGWDVGSGCVGDGGC